MVKIPEVRLTGAQLRAARALLNWSAQDLAEASRVSLRTIRRAEVGDDQVKMTAANEAALLKALEENGIMLLNLPEGYGAVLNLLTQKNRSRES